MATPAEPETKPVPDRAKCEAVAQALAECDPETAAKVTLTKLRRLDELHGNCVNFAATFAAGDGDRRFNDPLEDEPDAKRERAKTLVETYRFMRFALGHARKLAEAQP